MAKVAIIETKKSRNNYERLFDNSFDNFEKSVVNKVLFQIV